MNILYECAVTCKLQQKMRKVAGDVGQCLRTAQHEKPADSTFSPQMMARTLIERSVQPVGASRWRPSSSCEAITAAARTAKVMAPTERFLGLMVLLRCPLPHAQLRTIEEQRDLLQPL